jgi:type II secretion system protein G
MVANVPKSSTFTGFTLIELLVVMVLISILALVGMPTFQGSQRKARDGKRKADLAQVSKALEMYVNDIGRYPCVTSPGGVDAGFMTDCVNNVYTWGKEFIHGSTVYMQKLPIDPLVPRQRYYYEPVEVDDVAGKGFRLWAYLENKDDPDIVTNPNPAVINCFVGACNYALKSPNLIE